MTEINKQYGLWTTLSEPFLVKGSNKKRIQAVCVCGVKRSPELLELIRGRSKSCGCRGRQMHHLSEGDEFSNWTVIDEAPQRDGKRMINCQCKCGWKSAVRLQELVRGKSKSCGCLRNERFRKLS
jgi:hypothetical protein